MRTKKFYLIICFVLFSCNIYSFEMESEKKCYDADGVILKDQKGYGFYINYHASSERMYKIKNHKSFERQFNKMNKQVVNLRFKVLKDCDFQCDIDIIKIKTLPPWEGKTPISKVKECSQ